MALQVLAGLEHAEGDAVEQNHQHADSLKPSRAEVKAHKTPITHRFTMRLCYGTIASIYNKDTAANTVTTAYVS